jgi:tetratricopeptide (TPR) repeat protein
LLDEQFFGNQKYHSWLTEKFIAVHADRNPKEASGEKPRPELFDQFSVRGTPTVLVVTVKGEEIDRLVGYGSDPDNFRDNLEKSYKGDDTFLNLTRKLKKDPDNLKILVKLARKHEIRHEQKTLAEYGVRILEQPEKARKIKIDLWDGKTVSAYEYARFTESFSAPGNLAAFLNEFPESPLRSSALANLRYHFRKPDQKQEAFEACRSLISKFPEDANLYTTYVTACAEFQTDVDQGIAAAEKYSRDFPGYFHSQLSKAHAELLLIKGEEEKAVKVYGENIVTRFSENSPDMLNDYAMFWVEKGKNLASAETAARKALELKNEHYIWDTLSLVLWKQGKHEEAIAAEEKALQLAGGKNEEYETRIKEIKKDMNK